MSGAAWAHRQAGRFCRSTARPRCHSPPAAATQHSSSCCIAAAPTSTGPAPNGRTALVWAEAKQHAEVVDRLLAAGARR